ncbi:MAG: hypothetical protein RLZZ418_293 [Pseudomonadota bacterium]
MNSFKTLHQSIKNLFSIFNRNSLENSMTYKTLFLTSLGIICATQYDKLLILFQYFINHNQLFIGIIISIIFSNAFKSQIENTTVFHWKSFIFYTLLIYSLYAIGEWLITIIPFVVQQINGGK